MNLPRPPTVRRNDPPPIFARLPVVMRTTGLGRSTIYLLMASGDFPAPVHLGPRAIAWRWSDLDLWSETRRSDDRSPAPDAVRRTRDWRSPAQAGFLTLRFRRRTLVSCPGGRMANGMRPCIAIAA